MKDDKRHLHYLHDLSDYKVDDDYADVRGWDVIDADGRKVGKVEGLLVNKEAKRVVYLDAEVDEALIEDGHETFETPAKDGVHEFVNKEGENHIIIPIGVVDIDTENNRVLTNKIDSQTFAASKRHKKGDDIDRSYELFVFTQYFPDQNVDSNRDSNNFYDRNEFRRR